MLLEFYSFIPIKYVICFKGTVTVSRVIAEKNFYLNLLVAN